LALSLWWLLPTPGLDDLWAHVGRAQLDLYRTQADPHWGPVLTVAALSGYWNDAQPHLPAVWPALALALLALSLHGLVVRRRDPLARALAVAGALGFLLALA